MDPEIDLSGVFVMSREDDEYWISYVTAAKPSMTSEVPSGRESLDLGRWVDSEIALETVDFLNRLLFAARKGS